MKSTVIPAQVTTVEDMIAGNLNFTQILLIVSSLFIDTFIYILVPNQMHFSVGKIVLMIFMTLSCLLLAMRIRQRLVLHWIIVLSTYLLRPHIYIFNKNDPFGRPIVRIKLLNAKKPKVSIAKSITKQVFDSTIDYSQISRKTDIAVQIKSKRLLFIKNL